MMIIEIYYQRVIYYDLSIGNFINETGQIFDGYKLF